MFVGALAGFKAAYLSGGSLGWYKGVTEAGLSLTGNELTPNDERIGVPREIQVRSMLRSPTLDMMVGEALRHDRASSYNNVLASADGRVVNVASTAALKGEKGAAGYAMACAEVGKHLGLPTHGYLVATDSKFVDAQAGGKLLTVDATDPRVLLGMKVDSWAASKDRLRYTVVAVDLAGKRPARAGVKHRVRPIPAVITTAIARLIAGSERVLTAVDAAVRW